jgi:hypothetical protein
MNKYLDISGIEFFFDKLFGLIDGTIFGYKNINNFLTGLKSQIHELRIPNI